MSKSLIIFMFITLFSFSQENKSSLDFALIDKNSKKVKYKNDITQLTLELTKDYNSKIEKTRAIFIWITENIKYDCRKYNRIFLKGKVKKFKCKTKEQCDLKITNYEQKQIIRTLKKGKGICGDYSMLFEKMCKISGINCYYINGYTKTKAFQIGKLGELKHAWNVVDIDGVYYYFDVTWASGGVSEYENGKLKKFYKKFNEYYWMTPIDKLSRNHYPKDTTWIKNSIFNKTLYKNNPYIDNSLISSIDVLSPKTGVLNAKVGDTIKFIIKYNNNVEKIQINSNSKRNPSVWKIFKKKEVFNEEALKKQKYIDFTKDEDVISFNYVIDNKSINFVSILFDYRLALKYRIKITN